MPSASTHGLRHHARDGATPKWAGAVFIVTLLAAVISGAYTATGKLEAPVPPVRWSEKPSNSVDVGEKCLVENQNPETAVYDCRPKDI